MDANLVWLASFPKSGSTWLRAFLTALSQCTKPSSELDVNALEDRHLAFRGTFEALSGLPSALLRIDQLAAVQPVIQETMSDAVGKPFTVKIHDDFGSVEATFSNRAVRGALYLVRDPRDVAISYAHHRNTDIDVIISMMADPHHVYCGQTDRHEPQFRQVIGHWSTHARGWLDQTRFPVHIMRYEDSLADTETSFVRALNFAGICASSEQIALSLAATSFERLQQHERLHGFRERSRQAASFFRSGRAGDWESVLRPDQVRRLESDHGDVMARLGYL